jgi:rubrerythrin
MKKEDVLFNFQNGLKAEERSIQICHELLGLIDNADDRASLERIIHDEARHIKITHDLIAMTEARYAEEGPYKNTV